MKRFMTNGLDPTFARGWFIGNVFAVSVPPIGY